MHTVFW